MTIQRKYLLIEMELIKFSKMMLSILYILVYKGLQHVWGARCEEPWLQII